MFNRKKQVLTNNSETHKPIRVWPGILIVVLQWAIWFGTPVFIPGTFIIGVAGGVIGGLAILLWWIFFSRAHVFERLGAIVLIFVGLYTTSQIIHTSLATAGQGMFFGIYAIPLLSLAFVVWAVVTQRFSNSVRRVTMILTILVACGVWTVLRVDGITGDEGANFSWRWTQTSEEELLSQTSNELMSELPVLSAAVEKYNWPGFRGALRNGIVSNVQINDDWATVPPKELWRRPIGPACSSFAVYGNLFYTQEQRGEDEIVACYNLASGEPVWRHSDKARFYDSHAGAGPRGTPTLSNGNVYAFGATGILNALDAKNGTVLWSRNVASDTNTKDSGWGFSSSPLVIDSVVVIAATGKLAAYNTITGDLLWLGPDIGDSYSSPHLFFIDGIPQVVMMGQTATVSLNPQNGTQYWEYKWSPGTRIVQPALTANGDILLTAGEKKGMCRITVSNTGDKWDIKEHWSTIRMRPDFNDFVVNKGYAYGYEGPSLACIDLKDGKRMWKKGRYGGQLILLPDQDLLLVLSEKGKLVLVKALPDTYAELAQLQVIEGRTWNHPVLVADKLLVRNTEEMAAYLIE